MNKYDALTKLGELRDRGILSEEEFQQEKAKILARSETNFQDSFKDMFKEPKDGGLFGGLNENTYCVFLHLSQYLIILLNVFGFAVPVLLWLLGKDKSEMVDRTGRNVVNWLICLVVAAVLCIPLCFIYVGYFGFILLFFFAVTFPVIGAVKASEGVVWNYPVGFDVLTFFQDWGNSEKPRRSPASYSSGSEQSRTDPGPPVKTHFSQDKYSSDHTKKYQ